MPITIILIDIPQYLTTFIYMLKLFTRTISMHKIASKAIAYCDLLNWIIKINSITPQGVQFDLQLWYMREIYIFQYAFRFQPNRLLGKRRDNINTIVRCDLTRNSEYIAIWT